MQQGVKLPKVVDFHFDLKEAQIKLFLNSMPETMLKSIFRTLLPSKLSLLNVEHCSDVVTNITSLMRSSRLWECYTRPSVKSRPHSLYCGHQSNTYLTLRCSLASRKFVRRTHNSSVIACRLISTVSESTNGENGRDDIKSNIEYSGNSVKAEVEKYFTILENFVSEEEQKILLKETEKYFKGVRYEYDHWDDAIHGYRETEKSRWGSETHSILQRVREAAFQPGAAQLPLVHVLDLEENGYIKPHVDSIKFCGPTIAGISLISPSIMKLVNEKDNSQWVKVLLRPGSLYIMREKLRFEYTHEILKDDESFINSAKIKRGRRVSVMFRDQPIKSNH